MRTEQIRTTLAARYDELTAEYADAVAENHTLRLVETADAAGDDSADSGAKVTERDTAHYVLRTILERRDQYAHALARLEAGAYGDCETCREPIPVERLEIFPAATACVRCQSSRERRAA